MLYFVRYVVGCFFCTNFFCQIACLLLCHCIECFVSIAKIDRCNLCVEICHSFCNSFGSVNLNLCFFGSNFCCESFCKSVDTILDDFIGIFNNVRNNNGFNFGNVANGFNRDNRISATVFKLEKLHANKDRDNNDQNESNQNDQRDADCGSKERNVVIGSKHKGDLACRNISFNNIVGFVFAHGYGVCILCKRLDALSAIVNVKIFNNQRLAVLVCDEVGSYGNVNVELFACCSTGNGECVALVCLQAANSLTSEFGGNAQGCRNSIGNTVFTNDNDCTVGSCDNLIVANNVHSCFERCCIEFIVSKCGNGCLYSVGAGSRGSCLATVVGVGDSGKNLLGKLYTVCTCNNKLILVANVGGEDFAIVEEFTAVENNVINLLCNGDVLCVANTVVDYVKCIGSGCNQCVITCVNSACEIFNRKLYGSACISTDCLDAGEVITVSKGSDAFPSNGFDYNRSYACVNLERSYGVVRVVQSYVNVGVCNVCANGACAKRYSVLSSLCSNAIVTNNAIECGESNCNVCVSVANRIVNNRYRSIVCPCKLCGLNFCGNNDFAAGIGNSDSGSRIYVCRVEYCSGCFAVHFNRTCYICVTVVILYPVTVLQSNIGALKGNGLYRVCVDRNDHAANHNREHCYKSHDADEVALACKLNLLMFHNITTFP